MEPKFQTSFIPKKQNMSVSGSINTTAMQRPKVHGTSLFTVIAVIIFIISIAGVGGAYFWKYYLTSINDRYKNELAIKEKQFNINIIEKLKAINIQIDSAKNILRDHVAMSKVFDIIQKITISEVRLSNMEVKKSDNGYSISMKGYGKNLAAVAFQSDVLAQLEDYNLAKVLKNPIIGQPVLESTGLVSFGFSADINPGSLSYSQTILQDQGSGANQ